MILSEAWNISIAVNFHRLPGTKKNFKGSEEWESSTKNYNKIKNIFADGNEDIAYISLTYEKLENTGEVIYL